MSPAKSRQSQKHKSLTIEFSGITTLVWNKKAGTAEAHLVDCSQLVSRSTMRP